MDDLISRQAAIDAVFKDDRNTTIKQRLEALPSAQPEYTIKMQESDIDEAVKLVRDARVTILPSAQPEIIRCKDCKHWRQQTNYQGSQLSFGFCESDDMWRSLYGETYEVAHIDTDDDFYCGYAERRTDD